MRFCPACGSRLAHPPPVACASCGARHWRNAVPGAAAFVVRAGRLLLVRRAAEPWRGRWDVPGGFCEPDEHPLAAAEREVREEAGLAVRVTGFLGMWLDDAAEAAPAPPRTVLSVYYHAVPVDDASEPTPDGAEVDAVAWFGPDGLPPDVAFPAKGEPALAAWRAAWRDGATTSPLPDRPAGGGR